MYNHPNDYRSLSTARTTATERELLLDSGPDDRTTTDGIIGRSTQHTRQNGKMVSTQDVRPSVPNTARLREINMCYQHREVLGDKDDLSHTIKDVIQDKVDYKQRHYHDYSGITTNQHLDEEYVRHMIIDIYAQYNKKEE
eukprot:6446768-Amphidinium_carterae.3